jgi:hypothetical protein
MLPYLFNLFLLQIVNVGFFPRDTVVFTYDELFLLTCNNDYIIKGKSPVYFDIFPIGHYLILNRPLFGRLYHRNISSSYFEIIY